MSYRTLTAVGDNLQETRMDLDRQVRALQMEGAELIGGVSLAVVRMPEPPTSGQRINKPTATVFYLAQAVDDQNEVL